MKSIIKKIIIQILTLEAKLALRKFKPKIVAVTGSVGKTSTKDALYTMLSEFYHVRKTHKSYNSEIGIPLTILGCPNGWGNMSIWFQNILSGASLVLFKKEYPEYLVLEIGADRPGEIKEVMQWVHPDISVVTRIGDVPVHVEFYKSQAEVVKEKSELVRGVKPDGAVILNADDKDVIGFKSLTTASCYTFGLSEGTTVSASYIEPYYEKGNIVAGTSFKVEINGNTMPVVLKGVLGTQFAFPVLASFAVASALGLSPIKVAEAFRKPFAPPGRMNILPGINGSTLIDDTYNASPLAIEEASRTIQKTKADRRKIAVLGDMLELGKYSKEEHERIGKLASEVFTYIFTVGLRAKGFADGALSVGFPEEKIKSFSSSEEAGEALKSFVEAGDLVYLKGSQGIRMEKATKMLLEHPEKAGELLVRQEDEWLNR